MRVLLVEDDERVRRVIRWLLEDAGIEVDDVRDGAPLADRAAGADVVVLDITTDGDDGLTALEELHRDEVATPTVVFTAYAQPYLRSAAEMLGAAAFLDRATDGPLLVEAVKQLVPDVTSDSESQLVSERGARPDPGTA